MLVMHSEARLGSMENLLSLHHCVGQAVVLVQSRTVQAPRYI